MKKFNRKNSESPDPYEDSIRLIKLDPYENFIKSYFNLKRENISID